MSGAVAAVLTAVLAVAVGCGEGRADTMRSRDEPPLAELSPAPFGELCRTRGGITRRLPKRIADPTARAVAPGSTGDRAAIRFVYRGPSENQARLASGEARQQIGLKLRAADGCNLVYVMWRSAQRRIEVSVKRQPGKHDHDECGVDGYVKVAPRRGRRLPRLIAGEGHTLDAAITGDDLVAWVDGRTVWQGRLDRSARGLVGLAGVRTDNVEVDLELLTRPADRRAAAPPRCLEATER